MSESKSFYRQDDSFIKVTKQQNKFQWNKHSAYKYAEVLKK